MHLAIPHLLLCRMTAPTQQALKPVETPTQSFITVDRRKVIRLGLTTVRSLNLTVDQTIMRIKRDC